MDSGELRIDDLIDDLADAEADGWQLFVDGLRIDPLTVENLFTALGPPEDSHTQIRVQWIRGPV